MEASARAGTAAGTELGIGQNVEAGVAYLFPLLGGLALWVIEDENEFVRFHAMQNMVFGLALAGWNVAVGAVLTTVQALAPLLGLTGLAAVLNNVLVALAVLFVAVQAFRGRRYRLPVLGDYAERQVRG